MYDKSANKKPYTDETPKFQREVVRNKDGEVIYNLFTPLNPSAYDWALGNLHNAVRWGKSFMTDKVRGAKLRDYMAHKEGFVGI